MKLEVSGFWDFTTQRLDLSHKHPNKDSMIVALLPLQPEENGLQDTLHPLQMHQTLTTQVTDCSNCCHLNGSNSCMHTQTHMCTHIVCTPIVSAPLLNWIIDKTEVKKKIFFPFSWDEWHSFVYPSSTLSRAGWGGGGGLNRDTQTSLSPDTSSSSSEGYPSIPRQAEWHSLQHVLAVFSGGIQYRSPDSSRCVGIAALLRAPPGWQSSSPYL